MATPRFRHIIHVCVDGIDLAALLREKGWTAADAAAYLGCSSESVRQCLKARGRDRYRSVYPVPSSERVERMFYAIEAAPDDWPERSRAP